MDFISDLNDNQYHAVTTSSDNVRVVAGAGSGKTRVLTYRIAYLITEKNVKPWEILAITFTNKVAQEMKSRIVKMYPHLEHDLTIKTFHSFAAMFLRREISVINFPVSFTILDEEDQVKLIKDIGAELGYKKTDPLLKKAIGYISINKLKEKMPDDIVIKNEFFEGEKDCLEIYTRYEEQKNKMFTLDFDDLLLKTNYILTNFPEIRNKWQRRINYILVDEFQDTNDVEYRLLKLISKPETSLYVVGDPDQTIYTWRGANQDIILNFEKDFSSVETIVLDRNYRSTQNILDSANKLIAYNKFRVPKDLYTNNTKGDPIFVRVSPSVESEADYVAREIRKLNEVENIPLSNMVILYRSNYISLEFERALTMYHIPYKIFGGVKFYQRKEIKDVISFFNLVVNKDDNIAFDRIINVPRRGIGDTSINILKKESQNHGLSYYQYIEAIDCDETELSNKVINSLKSMVKLLDITRDNIKKDEEVFSKILEDMLSSLGYFDYLIKEEDGEERLENVKALFADLRHYKKLNPDSTFDEYLQNIALISSQDELVDGDNVTMMTVHTAKGLEFPVVFIVRFNDTVFPHSRSMNEGGFKGLEEERRLAYVAMTRAMNKLYLSCANGFSYVAGGSLVPSQFYRESGNIVHIQSDEYNPYKSSKSKYSYHFGDEQNNNHKKEYIDEPVKQDFSQLTNDVDNWAVGDVVIHKKLGQGVVIALEGDGIIKVNFKDHGIKSILGSHPAVSKGSK